VPEVACGPGRGSVTARQGRIQVDDNGRVKTHEKGMVLEQTVQLYKTRRSRAP
jgi:hypothetical protein